MPDNITSPETTSRNRTKRLTLIGLMTAVLCILGPFSIPLPNFVVYITVYILGRKCGTATVLLYLILGTAGLPVFSGFSGGLGKLAGPTGGYLLGFLFIALLQGFFTERFPGKKSAAVAGMILGLAICYTFGAALAAGVIPYLPGDVLKIILAAAIGPKLRARVRKI